MPRNDKKNPPDVVDFTTEDESAGPDEFAEEAAASASDDEMPEWIDDLQDAREHFQRSGREALLGITKLLDVMMAEVTGTRSTLIESFAPLVLMTKSLVEIAIARLPDIEDSESLRQARRDALTAVRNILRYEMRNLRRSAAPMTEDVRIRLEALKSIEQIVNAEIEKLRPPESPAAAAARVRKVSID